MLWPAWLGKSSGNKAASGDHKLLHVPLWPEIRVQLSENKKLKALIKWFWMIFVSAVLVSYQPFVSYYPPQQKETYTRVSYKIAPQLHEDGGTVLRGWTCTKIPQLEAYNSFCWTRCGGSNQAELDGVSNC